MLPVPELTIGEPYELPADDPEEPEVLVDEGPYLALPMFFSVNNWLYYTYTLVEEIIIVHNPKAWPVLAIGMLSLTS